MVVVEDVGSTGDSTSVTGVVLSETGAVVGTMTVTGTVTVAVGEWRSLVSASSAGQKIKGAQRATITSATPRTLNAFCTGITSLEQQPTSSRTWRTF